MLTGLGGFPTRKTCTDGVSGSFDGKARIANFSPEEVGENTTSTVQVPKLANVCPEQLSFLLKSTESAPEIELLEMLRFPEPMFLTVTTCDEDKPLTILKEISVGRTDMSGSLACVVVVDDVDVVGVEVVVVGAATIEVVVVDAATVVVVGPAGGGVDISFE